MSQRKHRLLAREKVLYISIIKWYPVGYLIQERTRKETVIFNYKETVMKRKLFVFMFLVLAFGLFTHTAHAYDILELDFGPSPAIGTWGFTTLPGWGIHNITEVGAVLQVNWSVDIIAPGDASVRQLWIQSPVGESNADPPVLLGIFENINGPLPQSFGGTVTEFNTQYITGDWKM
jgi:hypothetical protein